MQKKLGFTLVELLIVIAIIAILGSITLGIMGISKKKALTLKTTSSIHQISSACQSYQKIFQNYPDLNYVDLSGIKYPNGDSVYEATYLGATGTLSYSSSSMIEFNKRLRYFLEDLEFVENPKAGWAKKKHEPLIQEKLGKKKDSAGAEMYLDGWGNPLRVWWGRNHTTDTPKGANNLDSSYRYRKPLDIYSTGLNKKDEIELGSNDTQTTVDFTANTVDDIANWQGAKAK